MNLSHVPLRAESPRNLAECCIVRNMCLTASLICRSALIRKESRGAHVRMDITQTHDARTLSIRPYILSQFHGRVLKKFGADT